MNKPAISIILPTFNRANTLINAIDSILNQRFKSLELIIIDDASTDSTQKIIKAYIKKDSRVVLLKNKKNYGCSKSRNIGLSYARSEVIGFMDDDDQYTDDETLKCLYYHLEHTSSDLVIADYEINGTVKYMNKFGKNFKYNIIRCPGPFLQCILIRKKIITNKEINFDKQATPSEDWDFFITLSKLNIKIAYCAYNSFKWSLHQDSQSINFVKEASALTYICDKHYKYMLKNTSKKIMSSHYRRIARVYERINVINKIHQFYKKAFIEYPFSVKNIFYRVMIIIGYQNTKPLINWVRQLRGVPNA